MKKIINSSKSKQTHGTKEWAAKTHNIGIGCSHGCLYCYALAGALRFKRVASSEEWKCEHLKKSLPSIPHTGGTVMFPSTHDITPFYLPQALVTLKGLLEAGNQVLIVSKPHLEGVSRICEAFEGHKEQILFRFSIGTLDEKLAAFWEPGAPTPAERFACLQYAYHHGFQTSVSMEPMLAGTQDAVATFYTLVPWVKEKVWIGKMNQVKRRVPQTSPEIVTACDRVLQLQSDEAILDLVRRLGDHPQVAWKDSIRDVLGAVSPVGTTSPVRPAERVTNYLES